MTTHGLSMCRVDVQERYDQVAELTLRGYSAQRIAEKLNFSTRLVHRARKDRGLSKPMGRKWTSEELALAEQLLDDGCSYREVGRTLGRSSSSVDNRFPGRSRCTSADGPRLRKLNNELKELQWN